MIQSCTLFLHFSSSSVCLGRKRNGSGLLVLATARWKIKHVRFLSPIFRMANFRRKQTQDIHTTGSTAVQVPHQQTRVLNYYVIYVHTLLCTKMWYINDECVVYCSFGSFYFTYALPLPTKHLTFF